MPLRCRPEIPVVSLLFSKSKCLRISFISAIISDATLVKDWFLNFSNQYFKIWWKGSSKHMVMVFLIFCLFLPTMVMESAVCSASLQMASDLIITLCRAPTLPTIYNRKHSVCFLILKYKSELIIFKYKLRQFHVSINDNLTIPS